MYLDRSNLHVTSTKWANIYYVRLIFVGLSTKKAVNFSSCSIYKHFTSSIRGSFWPKKCGLIFKILENWDQNYGVSFTPYYKQNYVFTVFSSTPNPNVVTGSCSNDVYLIHMQKVRYFSPHCLFRCISIPVWW